MLLFSPAEPNVPREGLTTVTCREAVVVQASSPLRRRSDETVTSPSDIVGGRPVENAEESKNVSSLTVMAEAKDSMMAATGELPDPPSVYYIVDDERVNLRVASRFMKTCGLAFQTFEDGADLPKPPLPSNVKAILLDIVMKRSDGVQVCRSLRSGGCRVPIIAMTGNVSSGSIEQYKGSGFNGVLSKPFTVGDIRRVGEYCDKWVGGAVRTGVSGDEGEAGEWFTNSW